MADKKRRNIKITIIVLAVLLIFGIVALVGTHLHNKSAKGADTTVSVPDNLITSEADEGLDNEDSDESTPIAAIDTNTDSQTLATSIALYNNQPQDNTAFAIDNMFPGDNDTKYYGVQVSYHDAVTVHFGADVRMGYEKLAEVMKVKVKLLNNDEVMYDGLMKDMPDSVTHKLTSAESTTDELYYEITAYLDTSVGNEYQNQDLVADFNWWVEETGNLDKAPQTGDTLNLVLWIVVLTTSAALCLVLLVFRKKKEDEQNV